MTKIRRPVNNKRIVNALSAVLHAVRCLRAATGEPDAGDAGRLGGAFADGTGNGMADSFL